MNVDLNKRCRIEYKSVTQNSLYGTEQIEWKLLAVVWCNVQDVLPSRAESIEGKVAISKNQARFRCRFRKDIDSAMRISIAGVIYQIISGPAVIGKNEFTELMLERY